MGFGVVIPARFESSRLPAKVLLDIGGKPMVVHTYERAIHSGADFVVVATDDARVVDGLAKWDIEAMLTRKEHRSGSERIAQVAEELGLAQDAVVVNVQADEPLIPPAVIRQVANNLVTRSSFDVATLCEPIHTEAQLFDPNAVKVVTDQAGRALYFSRAPIPWYRDAFADGDRASKSLHFRHIGIYAYRVGYLLRYVALPACELETVESLEQLRVLYHGGSLHCEIAEEDPGPGIDTPDDLADIRALFAARSRTDG
ncbi:MAG: 3-deoxy-manno-octulosonate cytidylyltransferase [Gammaproteobacteria bacterium]|nr:3-deoxy-manno-octulosonate cytidylyltransferase [Gammaproteobacteria bacterium]